MTVAFKAVAEPSAELLTRVSALQPENPFVTAGYVDAMHAGGFTPILLLLEQDGKLLTACTAFSTQGWLNRRLEITSIPEITNRQAFWTGLQQFCGESGITVLEINSFASTNAAIEGLPGETARKSRCEFQLDLGGSDLWRGVNRHHRRKIKKGKEAGLRLRIAMDANACQDHARLGSLSLDRRRRHGETIADRVKVTDALAFTQNRAGEIYQAVLEDEILSSILVLRSAKGAYAQSSGTSDEGMQCGASQFLWYEIACHLQGQSVTVFNLGGADKDAFGLQEFKEGFGARRVELEAAEFYLGGNVRKAIGTIFNRLRGKV